MHQDEENPETQIHKHMRQGSVTVEMKNGKRNYSIEVPVLGVTQEAFTEAAEIALAIENAVRR